jgi:hypothetical protein
MTELTLEALGLDQEKLSEKLVDRLAKNVLTSIGYDPDGDEWFGTSPFANRLNELVRARLDQVVNDLADKHVLPRVNEMVEGLVLQETNKWGEKVGKTLTFIEYLTQRADAYMSEPVSYNGKTKAEDSYNWRQSTTRIAYMVDQHLQYSISRAMEQAMKDANTSIATGLKGAVEKSLGEVLEKLKIDVKTK